MSANERFLREVEHNIVQVNREVLGQALGTISRTRMSDLARQVALLRADYLRTALNATWTDRDVEASGLSNKRQLYEESIRAFDALERAVHRGYVDVEEI